jgi:hypothetical protein
VLRRLRTLEFAKAVKDLPEGPPPPPPELSPEEQERERQVLIEKIAAGFTKLADEPIDPAYVTAGWPVLATG